MRQDNPEGSVQEMCDLFGKSRQAWYKTRKAQETREMQEVIILGAVKHIRKTLPRCGLRKLHFELQNFKKMHQIKMGRDKLAKLLREHNLLIKKKKGPRTTNSNHRFRRYENKTKDWKPIRVNQLWVSDITYIPIGRSFVYLSLITDAYSRKIVGWSLRKDLTHKGPEDALKMALKQRKARLDLMHHSDRGIQYCCDNYIRLLKKNKIEISMTQNGDPYENALAERIHRTLKEEFLQYYVYGNYDQAKEAVARAIHLYNHRRPHLSLDFLTPDKVYFDSEELRKGTPQQLELFTSPEAGL